MPFSLFNVLHEFLEASLTKYSIRTPISSRCRLFITLIYLAHGGTRQFHTIVHRIGLTTFRKITLETCMTIWDLLADLYVATPSETEWGRISNEFKSLWNMPNCVGSIDGKHINITCPANSGSMYYNYKGNYSIVLLAVCDANYTFTCAVIGMNISQVIKIIFCSRPVVKSPNVEGDVASSLAVFYMDEIMSLTLDGP
ncbi:protein ANTAGONIST OF LIKE HETEROCHROMATIN PROTEIN 1-like [Rhagoletis pomonella]|uniref:protein ANTAGONIST OF LIKE HETEROCHROMATIN PROTEIN 1-like n=1 Tax=Rhagoletis pomonella TaxID=28610 RepID=UPI00178189D2|nr:protein ANTAGONIST OF LIKE HETEROCHROMATIN PROTEIN 1-like [Rhagoletis pomonella]